ncbi:proto-oncoprotein c-Rel [Sigmodon hispidus]
MQLRRPSDQEVSESMDFRYLPDEKDEYGNKSKKQRTTLLFQKLLQDCAGNFSERTGTVSLGSIGEGRFIKKESNLFSHGTILPEMPRSSGVSSQAKSYYSSPVSISSGLPHHPPAIASVVSPPTSWSSVTHPTSCSVSTNTLSSFSAGTLPSNSQGILPFLEGPMSSLSASNACLYTDDLARMETSSMSSADLYSISDVNMLSNHPVNVMTASNDNMEDIDNPRLVSINLENPSCNSRLDQRDLRQLHQMSSANMSAGTSSSSVFVSQSDAFDRSNFSCVENGLINDPGPSNDANSHNFVQSSQYSSIDALQSEQLNGSFAYDFFKI